MFESTWWVLTPAPLSCCVCALIDCGWPLMIFYEKVASSGIVMWQLAVSYYYSADQFWDTTVNCI